MTLKTPKEIRGKHAQRGRQADDGAQGRALSPALQLTNVCRVIPALEGEGLLRKPFFFTEFSQSYAEESLCRGRSTSPAMLLHAQTNTATIQTIVTRDYSADLGTWRANVGGGMISACGCERPGA